MFVRSLSLLILLTLSLERETLHAHLLYNKNLIYESYELIDLGETDVAEELLSRSNFPASLGPRINQKGHVSGNANNGGFVYDGVNPRLFLTREGQPATIYDINDKGIVLASLRRDIYNTEWILWPYSCFCQNQTLLSIDLKCISGRDLHFRSLNDKGVLVGSRYSVLSKAYRAVFYSPQTGLQDLTCSFLLEVNNNGNMAGYESHSFEQTPLIFHYRGGWNGLSDEASMRRPKGCMTFRTDMAIAPDNTVFGSYITNVDNIPYLYGYAWNPCERYFRTYDLNGMQISAVNNCHVLVGTLGGQAVISNNMGKPVTLASHICRGAPNQICLIEATDINDSGQIVGYGRWDGSLHIFLLNPIR